MLAVLQGIPKVCERLACWSAHHLKHNLEYTLLCDHFNLDQILHSCFSNELLEALVQPALYVSSGA